MIRVSASVNFQGRVIRVSTRMSRIPADLRPQADASAVRTTVDRRFLKLNVHFDGRKVELTWGGQAEAPSVASCCHRASSTRALQTFPGQVILRNFHVHSVCKYQLYRPSHTICRYIYGASTDVCL